MGLAFYDYVSKRLEPVQFLFNFSTEKYVLIKDWRLGGLLRLFELLILIYVLYDIIISASYLTFEVPKGLITPSASMSSSVRRNLLLDQSILYDEGDLKYCTYNNSTTNSAYEITKDETTYENIQCVVVDPLTIPVSGETQYLITTFFQFDKLYYIKLEEGESCPAPGEESVPSDARSIGEMYGTCIYEINEQYFPIAPEDITIKITHSFYTSSVVDKAGTLPKTYVTVPSYDEDGITFAEDEPITMTVKELLDLTGIDLDERFNQQPNYIKIDENAMDDTDSEYPITRLSGLTLIVSMNYYQKRTAPQKYHDSAGKNIDDPLCVVEIEPQLQWTIQPGEITYMMQNPSDPVLLNPDTDYKTVEPGLYYQQVNTERNGINIVFQVGGSVGKFDWNALIDAIVNGSVMLSIAQIIVTYIALYAMGLTSQLYMEFMKESVEWREEYARFACQAMVAAYAFVGYDTNRSGKMDRKEIYKTLKTVLRDKLDDEKLACLTDFVMRQGDKDDTTIKGRLLTTADAEDVATEGSTISVVEWIEIITDDKVSFESLERLIDSEYTDQSIKDFLLNLAEGPKRKDRAMGGSDGGGGETSTSEKADFQDAQGAFKQALLDQEAKDESKDKRKK